MWNFSMHKEILSIQQTLSFALFLLQMQFPYENA